MPSVFGWSILLTALAIAFITAPSVCVSNNDEPLLRFRRISTEHGFSHAKVHSIHQDKLGLMWFGTADGKPEPLASAAGLYWIAAVCRMRFFQ